MGEGGYLIPTIISKDVSSKWRKFFCRLGLAKPKYITVNFSDELIKSLSIYANKKDMQ